MWWILMAWFSLIVRDRRRAEVVAEAWKDLDAPCPYSDFIERRWWRKAQEDGKEWLEQAW